jgi:hypothetical protein
VWNKKREQKGNKKGKKVEDRLNNSIDMHHSVVYNQYAVKCFKQPKSAFVTIG